MGISISQIANSQQFATWLTRTNQIISLISSNVITLDSSAAGSLSSGNTQVNGNFYAANSLIGLGLYGGTVAAPANLNIYTNTVFYQTATPFAEFFSNSTAANVIFNVNTFNLGIANVQGNVGFTGNVTFNANVAMGTASQLKIGGNLAINSSVLTIGNSTVNVQINSSFSGFAGITNVNFGNSTVNATMNSTVIDISTINSTANSVLTINSSYIALGNSTVNVSVNSTVFSGTSNNSNFLGGYPASYFGTSGGGSFNPAIYAGISNATTLTAGSNTQTNVAAYVWSGTNTALVAMGNSGQGAQIYSNSNVALTLQSNQGNPLMVQNATANFIKVFANGLSLFSGPLQANAVLTVGNGSLINAYTGNANNLGVAYGLGNPGTAFLGWNLSNTSGELDLVISGTPANGGFTIYNFTANVLTSLFSVNTTALTTPGLTINTTGISVNGGLSINVGTNSSINSSTMFLGNGTQNYLITSGLIQLSNLIGNVSITPQSIYVLGGFSTTGNLTLNSTSLMIGNTVSNSLFNQGGVLVFGGITSGNVTLNASSLFIGNSTANTTLNSSSYGLGNSTVYTIGNSIADVWVGTSNITVNNSQITVGANLFLNTTSMVIGNSTVNTNFVNAGLYVLGGVTSGNLTVNSSTVFIGNSTVNASLNSSSYTGSVNNSTYFGGNPVSFYANVTNPNFSISMQVGANVVANTTTFMIGNSTVNTTFTNSGLFVLGGTSGNVTLNSSSLFLGNSTSNLGLNSSSLLIGNTLLQSISNTLITANLILGNSTVNASINSTSFSITNFLANTFQLGNSTVNVSVNSTNLFIGNTISTVNLKPISIIFLAGSNTGIVNTSGHYVSNSLFTAAYLSNNLTITDSTTDDVAFVNTTTMTLGNSTVNAVVNSTGLTISGTTLGINPPTLQKFLSGSGTYTKPAGVTWIRFRAVGGGGGGAGAGSAGGTGGTGGTTTFGTSLLSAGGGAGGSFSSGLGGVGGTASTGSLTGGISVSGGVGSSNFAGSSGLIAGGAMGAGSALGGCGGGGSDSAGRAGATNTGGGGGGGDISSGSGFPGPGGGSGAFIDIIISNPSSTYSYSVGAAGTAGSSSSGGYAGGAGGSGGIWVEEHYGS